MLALALLATSSANDDGLDEQRAIGAQRFKLKEQLSALRIKYRKDETTEALEEKLKGPALAAADAKGDVNAGVRAAGFAFDGRDCAA